MELVKKVERIIIATLIKLLAIRIDASSLSGFWSNSRTILLALLSFSLRLFIWVGVSEKKDDSEPDMRLDKAKSKTRITRPTATPIVIGYSSILGSASTLNTVKSMEFNYCFFMRNVPDSC